MSDTITEMVREGLRTIMQIGPPCPTCGSPGEQKSLRKAAALTGVSFNTISRFLKGNSIDSDTLDKLYEAVGRLGARAAEPKPPESHDA